MKFTEHLKRAEGAKSPKVELTISIDGVAIQEPKSKKILHQYPLHRISYCADDKADKKFFSFIAKEAEVERHVCFVFVSDKLAEEITLTIGQAFDLAYRRFLETSGRDLEMRRQLMILQKRVQDLEKENGQLKAKVAEFDGRTKSRKKNAEALSEKAIKLTTAPLQPPPVRSMSHAVNLLDIEIDSNDSSDVIVNGNGKPEVGRKLENLSLDDLEEEFNPRALDFSSSNGHSLTNGHMDVFGSEPFEPKKSNGVSRSPPGLNGDGPAVSDPFGMDTFVPKEELEEAIGAIDKKLAEMRVCSN